VGELAAGVAHEVNNPVNYAKVAAGAMGSYVSEIRQISDALKLSDAERWDECAIADKERLDTATAGLDELAAIVREGLERTGRLVGDLLELAAPWQGPKSNVDIRRVVDSAVQLIRYKLQSGGVSLLLRSDEDIPQIKAEPRALGQVFINILKNATEALEPRGGSIAIEVRKRERGVLVEVQDDGPGIDPTIVNRLFEPFFSTKPAGRGSGLGLSICRQVVEEHGGHIAVSSDVGRGARFAVWLPQGIE
jgi:signal transduction histidine kinase